MHPQEVSPRFRWSLTSSIAFENSVIRLWAGCHNRGADWRHTCIAKVAKVLKDMLAQFEFSRADQIAWHCTLRIFYKHMIEWCNRRHWSKYPTINQSLLFHNKAGARTLATKKKTQGALMDPTLSGKIQNTKVRGWNPNDLNDWFLLNKNNKCHWHVWYCLHGSHILCQISLYDDFCLW